MHIARLGQEGGVYVGKLACINMTAIEVVVIC